MLYLDNAATTTVDSQVLYDIYNALNVYWANPSSIYQSGKDMKNILNTARKQVADYINAEPEEIIFTSGGSESNNLALKGVVDRYYCDTILTTEIEHPSVYESVNYLKNKKQVSVGYIPVDDQGIIDLNCLEDMLEKHKSQTWKRVLVSIMFANNEIGTIQNIKAIGELCDKYSNVIFHTDAVQAFGQVPIDVKKMKIGLMSVSGHKFHLPKGIGFLYKRKDIELEPLIHGGHQENNLRAGTENIPYIYAMGRQIERMSKIDLIAENCCDADTWVYIAGLKLKKKYPEIKINGSPTYRLKRNLSITIPGIPADMLIAMLDDMGVCVSAGSACSSGEAKPSRVLRAIGLSDKEASETIRVSWAHDTFTQDLERFVDALIECIDSIQLLLGTEGEE